MTGVIEEGAASASEPAIPPPNSNGRKTIGRPFPKGVSGNPNGRPRIEPRVRRYARKYDRRMCKILAEIAADPKVPATERRRAAMDLVAIGSGRPAVTQEVLRPTTPLVALQVNQGIGPAATTLDPVDAVVSLATEGHLMSEEQREAIVSSVFARANRAAQRVAERPRRAIETPPAATAEPAPTEKALPDEAPPLPVESAAPGPRGVALEGAPTSAASDPEEVSDLEALRRIGGGPPPEPDDDQGETFMTLDEAVEQMRRQQP